MLTNVNIVTDIDVTLLVVLFLNISVNMKWVTFILVIDSFPHFTVFVIHNLGSGLSGNNSGGVLLGERGSSSSCSSGFTGGLGIILFSGPVVQLVLWSSLLLQPEG